MTHFRFKDSVDPFALQAGSYGAVYANGRYFATKAQVAHLRAVLWIDVNGEDPGANELDIETGDATPETVLTWVPRHCEVYGSQARSRLYCNLSTWPEVKLAVARLEPVHRASVRYRIADPTGVPHMVAGADATQWGWYETYDANTATDHYWRPR